VRKIILASHTLVHQRKNGPKNVAKLNHMIEYEQFATRIPPKSPPASKARNPKSASQDITTTAYI